MGPKNCKVVNVDFGADFNCHGHAEVSVVSENKLVNMEVLRRDNERIAKDFEEKESQLKEANKLVSFQYISYFYRS